MARSIVDQLFDRLTTSFPANQAYTYDDVATDPMPPPVAHFLRHLLQHRATHELQQWRPERSAWFDYDHPEVKEAERVLRSALQAHARLPSAEWESALRRAIQRVTAYLIHPTQTLTHFVFGDQDESLSARTIQQRIRFFGEYTYLHEAVNRYLDREDVRRLERDRFEALLQRVDKRMTEGYEADEWLRLLQPLFDLMELATDEKEVPTPFLHSFFQEKNATALAHRLQTASVQSGTTSFSPSDLRRLITSEEIPTSDEPMSVQQAPPSNAEPPPSSESPGAPEPEPPPKPEPAPTADEPDQPAPLWKQFHQGQSPAPESPPEPGDESGDPLWTKFQPDASPATDAPAELVALERDVLGERGPSNRDLFVRKLFEGSREEYARMLRRLREAASWSEASQIIAQDVFRAHHVNIYSEPAVTFTNAAEDRFKKRNR